MRNLLLFCAAAFLVGCAHVEPQLAMGDVRPDRVLVTGSRIPQQVDPTTGRARTTLNVSVYSNEDLARTGVNSLGAALRRASPARP